jgi:hypothetical protein
MSPEKQVFDALFDHFRAPADDPLAGLDFSALPWPQTALRRRTQSFHQRNVVRVIRAAQAAGLEVREIAPDGRVIVESKGPEFSDSWDSAIDQATLKVRQRLS